jgi:hypothetical protein
MDLIDAAENGDIQRVRELLDSGADPNLRDNRFGVTALIMAWGYTEIVRLLLEKGADPNLRDNLGTTALMMAALEGETETVRLLLENGADPNLIDKDGDTAFGLALSDGHTDILQLLEPHIMSTKIQSRVRGRQTRNEIRTQKALQQLKASLLPTNYDLSEMIGKRLNRMPYNPQVSKRIREERENERIANYVNEFDKSGGKKKHKKTKRKKKPKKTKKRKKKPKSKRKK